MALVGYRFRPTKEEIISHYLTLKMEGHDSLVDDYIGEVDFYLREPWELPDLARIQSDDRVWYFFCRLNYKYANSKRASRTTKMGYWKLTGDPRDIKARNRDEVIGIKKNLVYQYKCPDSKKVMGIGWIMHEFQAINSPPDQRPLVLCRLKYKPGKASANSPNDQGEPSRGVTGSHAENNVVQNTTLEVDLGHQPSKILSDGEDFNLSFSLQSLRPLDNDISYEEEDQRFADSLLVAPYEYPYENYGEGSSDRATEIFHGESFNPHEGHNRSKEYRQMQMADGDDVLLMGASLVGSVATGTAEINCIEQVQEELPAIHRQYQSQSRDLVQEFPTQELQTNFSSIVGKDKTGEATRTGTSVVLRQRESFGTRPQKDREIIQVTNAKPDFKLKSNESASNDWKGRFIRLETPPSSHISCPPLLLSF